MPIDCFIRSVALRDSQYSGLIESTPRRVTMSSRVGWNTPSAAAVARNVSPYTLPPSNVMCTRSPASGYASVRALRTAVSGRGPGEEGADTHFMHCAVGVGPNHWPLCISRSSPWRTNLWIEKGADGSSAKSASSFFSSSVRWPFLHSAARMTSTLARPLAGGVAARGGNTNLGRSGTRAARWREHTVPTAPCTPSLGRW